MHRGGVTTTTRLLCILVGELLVRGLSLVGGGLSLEGLGFCYFFVVAYCAREATTSFEVGMFKWSLTDLWCWLIGLRSL